MVSIFEVDIDLGFPLVAARVAAQAALVSGYLFAMACS